MIEKNTAKLNNAGLSLVELIVTVLLTGFIMTMIVMFISTSRKAYEVTNTEGTLQTEAQVASRYFNELLLEAENCGSGTFNYSFTEGSGTADVIWMVSPDNTEHTKNAFVYFVVRESDTNKLRFCRRSVADVSFAADGKIANSYLKTYCQDIIYDKYSLLAEHVSGIELKDMVQNADGKGKLVELTIDLNYNSTDYTTTLEVSARNL